MILAQFQSVGSDLCARGLVSSNSGNLSVRLGERMIITRRGCRLGCLEEHDLIETGVDKNDRNTPLASSELAVHRAIYQQTSAQAVVHAHPPHAIALSLTETEIIPSDTDGLNTLEHVAVLGHGLEVKPGGLADIIAQALTHCPIVMVCGHGCFATGQLLEEAHGYAATLEESCRVLCLLKSLAVNQPGG